jgi:AcrR family transcriptional regulator
MAANSATRLSRAEREQRVLETAGRLFYAQGVHEVGMDVLIAATGLGKATVYRLFATKDQLIGAYLQRLAEGILAAIDRDIASSATAAQAIHRVLDAVDADLARPDFRGCPFNNASIEFADPTHPARQAARCYRSELAGRLTDLALRHTGRTDAGAALGQQLAVLVDGAYTNAAHLGPSGPARAGLTLARALVGPTEAADPQ